MHCIIYLHFCYYQWFDIFAGGLLVFKIIIRPQVNASVLSLLFNMFIIKNNSSQNNVIIIKVNVYLHQAYVAFAD
jgi:hypothetical protein